jgi:glycosyltransferase involved in cell wall biosynthesis
MSKILFVLKRREDYNAIVHSHIGLSTGLYNSANFMNEMLQDNGFDSKLVVVADNNCIDREVTAYRPTHVIIEALWVVPQKFVILQKLHPNVTWIIRIHSEMPFMAGEGMAMDWIGEYSNFTNIVLGINAPRMLQETRSYLQIKNQWDTETTNKKVIYLPNYYPQTYQNAKKINRNKDWVDVGCFGAVRPLKNHLLQAHAAINFAERIGKKLRFHINAGRIEMQGGPALSNLKNMFEQLYQSGHQLINHQWRPREDFLQLCSQMDIGLQVSFSETFNIVGADVISQGVPLVGSSEIPWSVDAFSADPVNSEDITNKLLTTYKWPKLNVWLNRHELTKYTSKTRDIWYRYFKGNSQ